ncbi:MAG: hypothetical protein ABR970_03785 [Roseiarcus sp.]|jgi:hypothetical protein
MSHNLFFGCSAAAIVGAGSILVSVAGAGAAMLPVQRAAPAYVQPVECAVGAHIGPLGGCILGNDDERPPVVIERRSADVPEPQPDGCATKSVTTTDSAGNTVTRTKSNC